MKDNDVKNVFKSEGDVNISELRTAWAQKNIDEDTKKMLIEDEKYFIHQSLSTPCLNVIDKCEGASFTDVTGKTYMDFHGNYVHNIGFSNPKVMATIVKQINSLSFCPRRYTNLPAINLAKKLAELTPGNLNKSLFFLGELLQLKLLLN